MTINKEGKGILITLAILFIIADLIVYYFFRESPIVYKSVITGSIGIYLFFINFFRNPKRVFEGYEEGMILAPADGTVVVIEPTEETECLHEKRIQVSIFMSVFNVHANWYPVNGTVTYYVHNNGHFMSANLPKSSNENERSTIIIETADKTRLLMRQIAGALARRIVTYAREGEPCSINQQVGFIKFGSRVDLFLPLDAEILVNLKQSVRGNETVIARLKKKEN
ncbi:MAG: phosphatidylserine decarboxylase family protein [Paludibacteraceae bacterium]|nr:phosphatidylserine decarboxylase family protein [Paludibacteraceae bacterium]MCR5570110.1 phosphatidylserine decarboxylase family protein [Paludibacteraceae bacterium]